MCCTNPFRNDVVCPEVTLTGCLIPSAVLHHRRLAPQAHINNGNKFAPGLGVLVLAQRID
jgi:hypothetical protein